MLVRACFPDGGHQAHPEGRGVQPVPPFLHG
ncbi:hypothetical protein GBAR_LOCUS26914 [Geodia barretti]|uniref:Uncharacterized protein n=1 Tax=Geodia barretti TaxID=519541 RepID=A0AA35TJQ9_GEOBA|nr:hypothetical protein GBAR_LOCUS26914 [Geodia barretti]